MLLLFAPAAGASLPGPTFCELNPQQCHPDVTLTVQLSMLPANVAEGEANEKQHDLLVFRGPKGAGFLYGKIREWRDPKGAVHRGFPPSTAVTHPQQEVIANGPYLVSAQVGIGAESPDALHAFADGFDRAGIAALMAREEQRRKADPETRPMAGVLP
jgi:hypothetical protein